MLESNDADDRTTQRLRRIARIWSALVIAVVAFVLIGYLSNWIATGTGDPYAAEDYPPIENLPPLFIFLSAVGLGIAWRWEKWGGAIAVLFQLANLPILLIHWPITERFPNYLIAPYGLSLIVATPGVLFLIDAIKTSHSEVKKQ